MQDSLVGRDKSRPVILQANHDVLESSPVRSLIKFVRVEEVEFGEKYFLVTATNALLECLVQRGLVTFESEKHFEGGHHARVDGQLAKQTSHGSTSSNATRLQARGRRCRLADLV